MNRILIIDDDSDCAQLTRLQLQQLLGGAIKTCQAASLEESVQLLDSGFEPELVMLDLSLPDGTGLECVTHIRTRLPNAHILIMTGRDRDSMVVECLTGGADGYLQKGCGLDSLSDAIVTGVSPEAATPP